MPKIALRVVVSFCVLVCVFDVLVGVLLLRTCVGDSWWLWGRLNYHLCYRAFAFLVNAIVVEFFDGFLMFS